MSGPDTALTAAEQERIFELAALDPSGNRLSPRRVAQALDRPEGMVRWFMYRNGLVRPQRVGRPVAYTRKGGEVVRFFSDEEDALILKLREAGLGLTAIAAALLERFGHRRRPRAVKVRLIMLAGFEAEAEDTAEARAEARTQRRAA